MSDHTSMTKTKRLAVITVVIHHLCFLLRYEEKIVCCTQRNSTSTVSWANGFDRFVYFVGDWKGEATARIQMVCVLFISVVQKLQLGDK